MYQPLVCRELIKRPGEKNVRPCGGQMFLGDVLIPAWGNGRGTRPRRGEALRIVAYVRGRGYKCRRCGRTVT